MKLLLILVIALANILYAACETPCNTCVTDTLKEASDIISANIKAQKDLRKDQPEKFQKAILKTTQEVLLPLIDVNNMIKHIVGRYHWKMASKSEQERFYKIFEQVLLKEYTQFILQTQNSQIHFQKPRNNNDIEYVNINANAYLNDSEKPLDIVFYTRCTCTAPAKWQIIDITVDNLSYLDQYRLKYAATVRNNGLRGLNNKLEDSLKTED